MSSVALSRTAILEQFHTYGCTREQFRLAASMNELSFAQTVLPCIMLNHLESMVLLFAKRWGWKPYLEGKTSLLFKKMVRALHWNRGQFELSGAPHFDLQSLVKEFSLNRECVNQLASEAGFRVITAGLTPITGIESIDWMPKGRYVVMREYLPETRRLSTLHDERDDQCPVQL